jgi:tRNA-Thr(GGU) m(6)t(6)A37 methyltransferase TsaA
MTNAEYSVHPIGYVRSSLKGAAAAPKQGSEGAPNAWIEIDAQFTPGLLGLRPGQEIVLVTWLHRAQRDTLQVHPRDNLAAPLTGVFGTRSADRPNPLGLHPVRILQMTGRHLEVGPLEAIDGTPVVDIKPVVSRRLSKPIA